MQAVPGAMWKARAEQAFLGTIITAPLIALAVVVPLTWGSFLHWRDILIGTVMYAVTGHGITVGFHRYFTHGSFKTNRVVKIVLAVAGSMAVQGPVKRWVADHRRHHAYSDDEGDPHSPHRYGHGFWPMARGLLHAHVGWLFDVEQTNQRRFIPDLLADRDLRVVDKLFAPLAFASLALPAMLGWLFGGFTLQAMVQAFFWAGLVRVALLHHVTWSINSICHTFGRTPFKTRDRSRNVWALAIISMGESWHNLHHSDPTAARHGVLRGQIDSSAFVIKVLEKLRLARDVRWPSAERIASRRAAPST
jgi:stearoyl-CoA desaturase (delta-9 desaturase)